MSPHASTEHGQPPAEATLTLTVSAASTELGAVRQQLTGWLADHGVPAPLVNDIVLAGNEALANAVEHAYASADEPGIAALTVTVQPDQVVVSVTDHGRWRDPYQQFGTLRGRGFILVEAVTDRFDLVHSDSRTTLTAYFRLPG